MYFCDLALGAIYGANIPSGHNMEELNWSASAVQEVFLSFMPRNYVLYGSQKLLTLRNQGMASEKRPCKVKTLSSWVRSTK